MSEEARPTAAPRPRARRAAPARATPEEPSVIVRTVGPVNHEARRRVIEIWRVVLQRLREQG